MGHTIVPYSFLLESVKEDFKKFRRALSKEDQGPLIDYSITPNFTRMRECIRGIPGQCTPFFFRSSWNTIR